MMMIAFSRPHAYGTMYPSSVVCLSVCNVCTMAKRYALSKNYLKKQIALPYRYPVVPIRTPYASYFPQTGY